MLAHMWFNRMETGIVGTPKTGEYSENAPGMAFS